MVTHVRLFRLDGFLLHHLRNYKFNLRKPGYFFESDPFCTGNHIISSAIWDKSARVNFSLTNQNEPVGRVQFVVFEKFTSTDISQIAREKSCDYLLTIHIQKFYTARGIQTKDVFSRSPFQFLVKTLWSNRGL